MEIHPAEMSQGENDYEKVIQRLTLKIREGAKKAELLSSASIYRVPKEFRKLNEKAYTSQLIAIGPLHRNDEHLQTPLQHIKTKYMNNLLCRMTQQMENQEAEQKKILQECLAAMEMSIEDAKKCYEEEVTLDVEMMLVDGLFILELFYQFKLQLTGYRRGLDTADPIFANSFIEVAVQKDLLRLGNQIPFFVLERLFPLTLDRIPNNPLKNMNLSLTDYVVIQQVDYLMRPVKRESTDSGSMKTSCWPRDCIRLVLGKIINNSKPEEKAPSENEVSSEEEAVPIPTFYHILHKHHLDYLPRDQTGKGRSWQVMPSASELVYAGVKFVPGTGNDLFKVKFTEPQGPFWWFRSARFEIPAIHVQEATESVLMNFIAFEQCCLDIPQPFTSYAHLMDMLVNSDKDAQVLEDAGVIHNFFGASEAATNTFSKLFKEVTISKFYFAETCSRAARYSKRFWPKNMAYLRAQYFASSWKFIAFCLGFLYFGITIAQLIISIIKPA